MNTFTFLVVLIVLWILYSVPLPGFTRLKMSYFILLNNIFFLLFLDSLKYVPMLHDGIYIANFKKNWSRNFAREKVLKKLCIMDDDTDWELLLLQCWHMISSLYIFFLNIFIHTYIEYNQNYHRFVPILIFLHNVCERYLKSFLTFSGLIAYSIACCVLAVSLTVITHYHANHRRNSKYKTSHD